MAKCEISVKIYFGEIEEIIKELRQLQTYKLFEGAEEVLVDINDVARVLAKHVKATTAEQKPGKWIPVSERLPELSETPYYIDAISGEKLYESERVLVFGENEHGFDCSVASVVYSSEEWHYEWSGAYDSADTQMEVLAWMPLPEPYAERSRNG